MFWSREKKVRSLKEKEKESELTPLVDSTEKRVLGRILRIPTLLRQSAPAEASHEVKERGGSSSETIAESGGRAPHLTGASRKNMKPMKLDESHPSFGPIYSIEQRSVQATKDKAWEHVLKKSMKKGSASLVEEGKEGEEGWLLMKDNNSSSTMRNEEDGEAEEKEEIKEIYSAAMRKVEQEAKKIYADKVPGLGSSFRMMMIKDGCFFLQLAFLILGGSKQLGYTWNDPIFSEKNKKDVKKWIEAMFYVGNQIPLIVLKELMKQTFFQIIVKKRTWRASPSSLCEQVLYNVLFSSPTLLNQQQPTDLLHALQNHVLGPAVQGHQYKPDAQIDLEAANEDEEIDGQDGTILRVPIESDGDGESDGEGSDDIRNRLRILLDTVGLGSAMEDRSRTFPSATELKRARIRIKKLESGGARGIYFESCYFWANLYLPDFPVDDHTEVMLRSLKTYEITSQQVGRKTREVGSYLKVMSDIVQTRKDAKILMDKGVLCVSRLDYVDKLPGILNRLSSGGDSISLTHEFRLLRQQISDYSSPLVHYKGILNIVVAFTVFQSILALLAYVHPLS